MIGALALKLVPVGRFLKAIPPKVWLGLGIIVALVAVVLWHRDQVSDAHKAGFAQGKAAEAARILKRTRELQAKAELVAAKIRSKNDEDNRRIAGRADGLRVSGPGKAACPGAAAGAGGRVAPGGPGNAAGPQVPAADRAAVPWQWLVDRAERCDLNRGEVLAWREWHRQLEEWRKQP